ncbi:MAG: hypothetical protein GX605_11190, partial [Chloroflexi bacterium]|nr:hypothetical protein [Chloroflexota bacterium]
MGQQERDGQTERRDEGRPLWAVRASQQVLDRAPWLEVWLQEVELPNGVIIPDYVWTRSRSFAMIFPLTVDEQV